MKKSTKILLISSIIVLAICLIFGMNWLLTILIEQTNIVCKGQKFNSPEEAIEAMEAYETEANDSSLDFCPPYELVYAFNYEDNTIVLYSYCNNYNGEQGNSYAVRILKKNDDGTLSFDTGFMDFRLQEPTETEGYHSFTNIKTSAGRKAISLLYLEKDSDKEIYVDGIKAEKILASVDDHEFYICYVISKPDTFLSNLFSVFSGFSGRHSIEIK